MLKNSIRIKLLALGIIPVILFLLLSQTYYISLIKDNIYEEKQTQTRELIDVGLSILHHYHELEIKGLASRREAQNRALDMINTIGFGERALDYFWINDFNHVTLAHPFATALIGVDASQITDIDGVPFFQEFVRIAREEGAGYVPYKWQYYDDETRIEPKLSYVAQFEPWEWIIGTGVYINDIEESVAAARMAMLIWSLIIAAITIIVVLYIMKPIIRNVKDSTGFIVNLLSKGDFSTNVPDYALKLKDEYGDLARGLDSMQHSLREMFKKTGGSVYRVSESSESLAASSEEMSASLQEVAASANEFSGNAQRLSSNANEMSDMGNKISQQAQAGSSAVENALNQMQVISSIVNSLKNVVVTLGSQAQDISKIVDTIKGISDQTNLLALNAAIEAARAGEHARGFAVVAEEVRKLAEKSSSSASEITDLVGNIYNQIQGVVETMDDGAAKVNDGTKVVVSAGEVLQSVIDSLEAILAQIEQVSAAAQEIGAGSEEVSAAVEEQTATMGEISSAANELQGMVSDLEEELSKFKY